MQVSNTVVSVDPNHTPTFSYEDMQELHGADFLLGWIPIAIAAASAIGSVVAAGGKRAQAKQQAAIIDDMIGIEEETFELNKDARSWEEATRRFNNQQAKYALQANTRTSLLNSRLQSLAGVQQEKEVRGNLRLAKKQLEIDAEVEKQTLSQDDEPAQRLKQQIAQEAGNQLGSVPATQSLVDDSLQGLSNMQQLQLAREDILAASYQAQGEISAQLKDNQDQAKSILRLQREGTLAGIETQKSLSHSRQRVLRQSGQFDRSMMRVQRTGHKLALRSEQLQQKALQQNQTEADRLTHDAKVKQLQLGQPSAPSLLPSLIGGATQIGSAVYGARALSTQQPTTTASAITTTPRVTQMPPSTSSGLLSMNLQGGQFGGYS